jgi:adenine-specific DNA-methyltransferase
VVLKARMNQDIRMGNRLKDTGADKLFVVFGEPDIGVTTRADGMLEVEIKGVDIFDPNTGEVRSSADPSDDIACWFIDDDYDEENFFVRHAYFLGNKADEGPYKALKRALKAEIDEDAWQAWPRPFPSRSPGPHQAKSASKSSTTSATKCRKCLMFKVAALDVPSFHKTQS